MFSSFLHCLSLPPGSLEASGPRPKGKPPWCFSWCQTPPRFCTSIWKESDECFLFLFLMSSMEDKSYFLLLLSSSMEEKRWLLKNPSSSIEDERPFYIFLFLPWKKMFSVKISFVFHGRRALFLHFLSSSMEDERSFFVLLSSPVGDECSFFVFR